MMLITGATGTIGGHVLRHLAKTEAPSTPVRAMVRDPSLLEAPPGAEVVQGDFTDPASLRRAADGATALFLATAPGPTIPAHDAAMIAAAEAAGVRRVVKLSAIRVGPDHAPGPNSWHAPGERALREADMGWTLLRPAGFASNALQWTEQVRAGAPVPNMSGQGRQYIVDPRDIAEAAVTALISPGHEGRTYTLTGPEPLSVPHQVATLATTLHRALTTIDVPPETAADGMRSQGLPPDLIEAALTGLTLLRTGAGELHTPDLPTLLPHPPRTFTHWAHDHATAFTAAP